MPEGLVRIGSYGPLYEANLVKSELEAFGIEGQLRDAGALADGLRRLRPQMESPGLMDRRRARPMEPVANAEEDRQALIHRGDLFPRKLPKYAPYPPLID